MKPRILVQLASAAIGLSDQVPTLIGDSFGDDVMRGYLTREQKGRVVQRLLFAKALLEVMLDQETDFLVRDLKAVSKILTGQTSLFLRSRADTLNDLLGNGRVERHLTKHHPDVLNALRGLLCEIEPEKAKAIAS